MSGFQKFLVCAAIALIVIVILGKLDEINDRIDSLTKNPGPEPAKEPEGPVYDVRAESIHHSDIHSEAHSGSQSESVHSDISPEKAIIPAPTLHSDSQLHSESESILSSGQNPESKPEFFITEDFRIVKVKGKEMKASPSQGRVVARLWENLKKGIKEVHQDKLLEDLGIYSKKIRDVFKNSPLYKTLVVPTGKGFYRLNIL